MKPIAAEKTLGLIVLIKLNHKANLVAKGLTCILFSSLVASCSDLINFETPTCESDDTADSVMEIINKKNTENSKDAEIRLLGQLIGRDLTAPVLKLSQRKTIKFDKETGFRACVANAKLANGESGDIGYTIRWEDKKSGTYYIEIKSAEVIIEQYTSAEEKAAAIAALAAQEKAKKDAIDADLAKKAADALQAEKEIAAKNAEPHEEIINPPLQHENIQDVSSPEIITKQGVLSVKKEGDFSILSIGEKVIKKEETFGFSIEKKITTDSREIFLVMNNSGGAACPVQFFFVEIAENSRAIASEEFGTCTDIVEASVKDGIILVSMSYANGKKTKYSLKNNKVTESN